ncbi:MAG: hypothetical protein AAB425_05545 [Bdellovibrionota bacterium]
MNQRRRGVTRIFLSVIGFLLMSAWPAAGAQEKTTRADIFVAGVKIGIVTTVPPDCGQTWSGLGTLLNPANNATYTVTFTSTFPGFLTIRQGTWQINSWVQCWPNPHIQDLFPIPGGSSGPIPPGLSGVTWRILRH